MTHMSTRVRITDVSPRDGLQNESGVIPTADKVRLVDLLCSTGVDEVEVTSFVSAKWVPQLGDAKEVFEELSRTPLPRGNQSTSRPLLSALVPNERGMDGALETLALTRFPSKVSVFTAASETFNTKNTNASIAQSIERFKPVVERAHQHNLPVRGYISCVIACPFEGPIAPGKVADVAAQLVRIGVDEIDLGDTIGAGTPDTVAAMLEAVRRTIGTDWWTSDRMTLHLHDTFGRAAECVRTALDMGVRSFDGSVAGLGGCPYASTPGKRAPGNIATETLVETIERAGYTTSVNRERLAEAAEFARRIVAKSRVGGGAA